MQKCLPVQYFPHKAVPNSSILRDEHFANINHAVKGLWHAQPGKHIHYIFNIKISALTIKDLKTLFDWCLLFWAILCLFWALYLFPSIYKKHPILGSFPDPKYFYFPTKLGTVGLCQPNFLGQSNLPNVLLWCKCWHSQQARPSWHCPAQRHMPLGASLVTCADTMGNQPVSLRYAK